MHKTGNKHKHFQNGKQLLQGCISKLNENQRGETGGNVALYPTVVVFLGSRSCSSMKHVKTTLDDNWNNARFLQYLHVARAENGWKCFRLKENSEMKEPEMKEPETENTVSRAGRKDSGMEGFCWESEGGTWDEVLDRAIVDMLETEEKIFSDRTTIKMEYVLDASEPDGISYFELYDSTGNGLQADERKTLYLMLDQRPGAGAEASDRLLRHMVERYLGREQAAGTAYLLSNYLQSGQMLGERSAWQNYRLAADLMLLGGNRREAEGVASKLFHGFKTVSYALVTKPADEIAAVCLRTLLQQLYETEQKRLYRKLPASEISKRLQIDRHHGFAFLEELFLKKLLPKLPKESDWRYLPFRSVQDCRRFFKSAGADLEAADEMTCGAASAFLDGAYLAPVREFCSDEREAAQCRAQIEGLFAAQFAYFELLYLKEHEDGLCSVFLPEYQFAGFAPKDSTCRRLHMLGIYESKRLFYEKMKQMMTEVSAQKMQQAHRFQELYAACRKEVQKECIVTGDESKSVEAFYGRVTAQFVERQQKEDADAPAFPQVFCVENQKKELLGAVWGVFLELIQENVFDCDFEQEVDARMDGMDEKQRHAFVAEELRKKLEGSRRLRNRIELPMTEAGCYYMVNASADYAKTLERADSREYVLFDLSRTDCIEQLKIYDILKPEQLHLILHHSHDSETAERMSHDNRKQTAGL
ncbi:MAG: hypothetical protein K2N87_16840 [Eubacterium sp.]|nr:hypothetical protein [Eubacterium sp.]